MQDDKSATLMMNEELIEKVYVCIHGIKKECACILCDKIEEYNLKRNRRIIVK